MVVIALADERFGSWARISVGILALAGFLILLRLFWRWLGNERELERVEAREKYRGIYRVLALPTDDQRNIWQLQAIEVGDYGWEAKPLFNNGLIYLQGLTVEWGWVWRAGFRPDQIEFVGPKPVSQYDWKDFDYDGPKPTACYQWPLVKPKNPCPFPVQKTTPNRRLQFPITCA